MTPDTSIGIPKSLTIALQNANHVVVFTGAGVSVESGIPTFRDALTGLWERFNAQDLATPEAFLKDEELVWGWYEWRRMKVLRAQPNPAHLAIAALAKHVRKLTVVTQNVDDLHERGGSTNVLHLHGSLHAPRCASCGRAHVLGSTTPEEPEDGRRLRPPQCVHCHASIRPGVVWFGEQLPEEAFARAFDAARTCDLLFSIGTSGVVQPASLLPMNARQAGARVVHVNPMRPPLDEAWDWSLQGAAGRVMPRVLRSAFPSARITTGANR